MSVGHIFKENTEIFSSPHMAHCIWFSEFISFQAGGGGHSLGWLWFARTYISSTLFAQTPAGTHQPLLLKILLLSLTALQHEAQMSSTAQPGCADVLLSDIAWQQARLQPIPPRSFCTFLIELC